jgi:hypothetical protein
MAWIMAGTATLYPVEITGGQNFGEGQDLPNELEALRVGDEFSAEVRSHPFGLVLDI